MSTATDNTDRIFNDLKDVLDKWVAPTDVVATIPSPIGIWDWWDENFRKAHSVGH